MRIMIGFILGIVVGYVTFAPDMASTRQQMSTKISEIVGSK